MAAKDDDTSRDDSQDNDHSLDISQTAVKKMIADARARGFITYDQLNAVLPPEQVSSDQIEDVMSMLSEMGIQVVENEEEGEDGETGGEIVTTSTSREVTVATTSPPCSPSSASSSLSTTRISISDSIDITSSIWSELACSGGRTALSWS